VPPLSPKVPEGVQVSRVVTPRLIPVFVLHTGRQPGGSGIIMCAGNPVIIWTEVTLASSRSIAVEPWRTAIGGGCIYMTGILSNMWGPRKRACTHVCAFFLFVLLWTYHAVFHHQFPVRSSGIVHRLGYRSTFC